MGRVWTCRAGAAIVVYAFALGALPPEAAAASIEPVRRPYCNIRVDGPIADGDLQKIVSLVERIESDDSLKGGDVVNKTNNMCLNSTGGSIDEVLRIIDYLVENANIGTVVDEREECYAACAFLFMGGRFVLNHGVGLPIRRLHVAGTLGFKAPSFKAVSEVNDSRAVQTAYAEGARAIAALVSKDRVERNTAFDRDRVFPRSLTLEMLGRESEDPLLVETTEQAGKWRIDLVGYREPTEINDRLLQQACLNIGRWRGVLRALGETKSASEASVVLIKGRYRKVLKGLGVKGDSSCTVDAFRSKQGRWFVDVNLNQLNLAGTQGYEPAPGYLEERVTQNSGIESTVGLPAGVPLWAVYNPDTKLTALREK